MVHQPRYLSTALIHAMLGFQLSRCDVDDGEEPGFVLQYDLEPSVSYRIISEILCERIHHIRDAVKIWYRYQRESELIERQA